MTTTLPIAPSPPVIRTVFPPRQSLANAVMVGPFPFACLVFYIGQVAEIAKSQCQAGRDVRI